MNLLGLGALLALDNIVVALALAPLCTSRAQFVRLTAWLAGVEAVAPLAGALFRHQLPSSLPEGPVSAALLATLGLSLLGLSLTRRLPAKGFVSTRLRPALHVLSPERWVRSGVQTAVLAILLGLDNLLAGAGLSPASAAVCGAGGAAAVVAACLAGRAIGVHPTPEARTVACAALLLTAGAMAWA
jgi:putative Mn2+ efflux pump MntP